MDNQGNIVSQGIYTTTVATNPRAMQIQSDGKFGGLASIRAAKKNIKYDYDSSWVLDLKPVSFNYRKVGATKGTYLAEAHEAIQYGLIAEDAETINSEICNYDDEVLVGVEYQKLITPILAQLQTALTRIESLEVEVQALKGDNS